MYLLVALDKACRPLLHPAGEEDLAIRRQRLERIGAVEIHRAGVEAEKPQDRWSQVRRADRVRHPGARLDQHGGPQAQGDPQDLLEAQTLVAHDPMLAKALAVVPHHAEDRVLAQMKTRELLVQCGEEAIRVGDCLPISLRLVLDRWAEPRGHLVRDRASRSTAPRAERVWCRSRSSPRSVGAWQIRRSRDSRRTGSDRSGPPWPRTCRSQGYAPIPAGTRTSLWPTGRMPSDNHVRSREWWPDSRTADRPARSRRCPAMPTVHDRSTGRRALWSCGSRRHARW